LTIRLRGHFKIKVYQDRESRVPRLQDTSHSGDNRGGNSLKQTATAYAAEGKCTINGNRKV